MPISYRSILLSFVVLSIGTRDARSQVFKLACFDAGLVGDCSSFIDTFCETASTINIFGNDSISRCFTDTEGFRCDLSAWNTKDETRTFDVANCENGMHSVTETCSKGGSGTVGDGGQNFIFTVNPDEGACGDTSALPSQ